MTQTYKYFAFISFQSADAKEALWVQKAIESYRLPTAISRKDKSLPKKMRPCFCYLNDINLSEELMQELKQRMEQSEYLIVVCSPRSAKSQFVNGGIDYFVNLGRRDRIIPLIIDGIPYSNDPQTECFPEALRRHFPKSADPMQDHQILGVNLNEEGAGSRRWKRQRAVLMVIARMLGLEFENLWNREVQRRRKRKITLSLIVCSILIALGLTWYLSRSVDVNIEIKDKSIENLNLPQINDAKIIISLKNEQKTADSLTIGNFARFNNIPNRFIGRQVRCQFTATDYLPLDTVFTLKTNIVLPIERDSLIYGDIHFRLRNEANTKTNNLKVEILGRTIFSDNNGNIQLYIPLKEQQTQYNVVVNGKLQEECIYMPCSEGSVFIYQ